MGSGNSRMNRDKTSSRGKRILSSLLCASSSPSQIEEYPDKPSAKSSVQHFTHVTDESLRCRTETSLVFDSEYGFNGSGTEAGTSSVTTSSMFFPDKSVSTGKEPLKHQGSANSCCKDAFIDRDSFPDKSISMGNEPLPLQSCANSCCKDASFDDDHVSAGTSYEDQNESSVNRLEESVDCAMPENTNLRTISPDPADGHLVETAPTRSSSFPSGSVLSLPLFGENGVTVDSSLGVFASDSDRDLGIGGSLLVDVVSITTNILPSGVAELSNREARRDRRRLFWDALSRRTFSRRHNDSQTIVFTTGHGDNLESRDQWLLDLSGDFHYDEVGRNLESLGTGRHERNERRWQLRSETFGRNASREEGEGQTMCTSGLHPEGSCSCESLVMGDESSTFASISRVVLLAEALFEVLDEIHRQPLLFSLSMPAPEAVVNSLPVKNHTKPHAAEIEANDVEQCNICLAEYEEGDEIRVLPCHHEYHMSCVDKWLKEIHGVCPLCRYNVGEGLAPVSAPNSEVSL